MKMDCKVSENGLDSFLISCLFELVELVFRFCLNSKHKSVRHSRSPKLLPCIRVLLANILHMHSSVST